MDDYDREIKPWVDWFLKPSTGKCRLWARVIVDGRWDAWNRRAGERLPVNIVKELYVAAQEVLGEDNG